MPFDLTKQIKPNFASPNTEIRKPLEISSGQSLARKPSISEQLSSGQSLVDEPPAKVTSLEKKPIEPIKKMPEVVNKAPQPKPMRNIRSVVGAPKRSSRAEEIEAKRKKGEEGLKSVEDKKIEEIESIKEQINQSIINQDEASNLLKQILSEKTRNLESMKTIRKEELQNTQIAFERKQEKLRELEQQVKTPERKKLISSTKPMDMLFETFVKGAFMAIHNLSMPAGTRGPYDENINQGQDFMSLFNKSVEKDYKEQIEKQTLLGREIQQLRELSQDDKSVFEAYKRESEMILQSKLAYYAENTRNEQNKMRALNAVINLNNMQTEEEKQQHTRFIEESKQEAQNLANQKLQETRLKHQRLERIQREAFELQKISYQNHLKLDRDLKMQEMKQEGGGDGLSLGKTSETRVNFRTTQDKKIATEKFVEAKKNLADIKEIQNILSGNVKDDLSKMYHKQIMLMKDDSDLVKFFKRQKANIKGFAGKGDDYDRTLSYLVKKSTEYATKRRIDFTGGGNMTEAERNLLYNTFGVRLPVRKNNKYYQGDLEKAVAEAVAEKRFFDKIDLLEGDVFKMFAGELSGLSSTQITPELAGKLLLEK